MLTGLWLRLKALVKRRQLDRDLQDELSFHLAMREEQQRAAGLDPKEAHNTVRRQFGNTGRIQETCRDMWTFASLEILWQDIRFAIRTLAKSPGFTTVAVLSLALGIAANSTIFSVLSAALFRRPPFPDPEQLVTLWETRQQDGSVDRVPIAVAMNWRKQ